MDLFQTAEVSANEHTEYLVMFTKLPDTLEPILRVHVTSLDPSELVRAEVSTPMNLDLQPSTRLSPSVGRKNHVTLNSDVVMHTEGVWGNVVSVVSRGGPVTVQVSWRVGEGVSSVWLDSRRGC